MDDFSWLYRSAARDDACICLLCPHQCRLKPGEIGFCRSRIARNGRVEPLHPSPVTAVALDPIEKKPLYHVFPGRSILSIGFSGCNLRCPFCQNWHIAQTDAHDYHAVTPEDLPRLCREQQSPGVAFTYSEPLVHIEYLINSAEQLKSHHLLSLLVTNGFINQKPGRLLARHMDAVKVDLKGFRRDWYSKELKGRLKPVLEFIEICAAETHLEVVTLVIPGKNDDPREIEEAARFLAGLNPEIPYHLTAYYPQYHYQAPPTPAETIGRLADKAREHLKHVYTGNLGRSSLTRCAGCGTPLIRRTGRGVSLEGLKNGVCRDCGHRLYGIF